MNPHEHILATAADRVQLSCTFTILRYVILLTVNIINVTESGLTWEVGLWTCLWGNILIPLIEVRRPTFSVWHHSHLGWDPELYRWRNRAEKQHTLIALCFLVVEEMY